MKIHKTIVLRILLLMVIVVSCKSQKQSIQSISIYGEESEVTFDGIPSKVVSAVKSSVKGLMDGSPEDDIPRTFAKIDKKGIHMGIPYEIYLIRAEALENEEVTDFDGLQLSGYEVPIIDNAGEEYVTFHARLKDDDTLHTSGYHLGGVYDYKSFLNKQKCSKTSRRIIIRRVPRSGYPRAFKFVGCLGSEQTLESGRYWAIEEIGNRLDQLDKKQYSWEQVLKKMALLHWEWVK
jgi:hypothetical protein